MFITMGNEAQKQFVTALNFLLKKKGHGSQARLARTIEIDSGYLNNIIKGRTPGPQEKKEKIASYFNLHYESMLSLGRWLLSGYPGEAFETISSKVLELSKEMRDPNIRFNIAMYFLLQKTDIEALKKLSSKCDIGLESLNNLLKGNFFLNLSSEKKEQIASYFDLHYESMLTLGSRLLSGHHPGETWQQPAPEKEHGKLEKQTIAVHEQHPTFELSARDKDKKDKNMMLIAEWINQQEDPWDYWTLLKMLLKQQEPEFKEWLKKRPSDNNQDRLPENKSVVGE